MMVRIDKGKGETAIGRTWTWIAKVGDGRVRMVTFQARYHWVSELYTFRARINCEHTWYILEENCHQERMKELRILYANAMTVKRFIEIYSDIFLTQSEKANRV